MTPQAVVLPPPTERYTLLGWLRRNLFSTWYNALLTFAAAGLIVAAARPLLAWAFTQAEWAVVAANLQLFMVGQYPRDELWRVWLCLGLAAALVGLTWGVWVRGRRGLGVLLAVLPFALALLPIGGQSRLALGGAGLAGLLSYALGRWGPPGLRRIAVVAWIAYFPLILVIIRGLGGTFLTVVPSNLWGGLLLTALLTVVGIVFSFPLGVLLALGRQSGLPIIRAACVTFIELVRGVPFISVLFMSQLMLPLFLPPNVTVDRVVRAMVGVVLFSAAYMAENVRGGLQAIPRGQTEAARALGLNGAQTMGLIILPQALRAVIPILVGQFIALFKDTSLVVIVGLLDLMGIAKTVLAQPQFLGRQIEVYLFLALIYGLFCYVMSAISQRLEAALGVGAR